MDKNFHLPFVRSPKTQTFLFYFDFHGVGDCHLTGQNDAYFPPASIILSVKCVKWLEMCQASHTSNGLVSVLNHVEYYDKQEQIL